MSTILSGNRSGINPIISGSGNHHGIVVPASTNASKSFLIEDSKHNISSIENVRKPQKPKIRSKKEALKLLTEMMNARINNRAGV
jgi:hypothetical protein